MFLTLKSASHHTIARASRLGSGLLLAFSLGAAFSVHAGPSEASADLAMLPLASVADGVSIAGASAVAVSVAPLALLGAGVVLTVKTVEASARGTVYVLERASDGARYSVEVLGKGARAVGASVGTAVSVTVLGTGLLLSAAGEVLAFVPNAIGRALLHNERVTR